MARKPKRNPADISTGDTPSQDPAIYVRTTAALKQAVSDAGHALGESERWVVERLIESFVLLNPEGQRDILQGRLALDRVSHLVALASWANHAFSGGHHVWAIECYAKLEAECINQIYGGWQPPRDFTPEQIKEAEERRRLQAERSPLRLFARYRQAFSWSELSLELRRRAMHLALQETSIERVNNFFAAARRSAERAVNLYRSIDKVHPNIALICYNTACCAASLAMMLVESSFQYGSKRSLDITELCRAVSADDKPAIERAWEIIGAEWRNAISYGQRKKREAFFGESLSIGVGEVDRYGAMAIDYLGRLVTEADAIPSRDSSGVPWPDPEYFPYKFWDDTDIVFLRKDAKFAGQYKAWAGTADDDWLLKNFDKVISEHSGIEPL